MKESQNQSHMKMLKQIPQHLPTTTVFKHSEAVEDI